MLQGVSDRATIATRLRRRFFRTERGVSAAALAVATIGLTASVLIAIFSR
jgi:hypothetical protein